MNEEMRTEMVRQLQENLQVLLLELIYNYMDHVFVYKGRNAISGQVVAVKMQKLLRADMEGKLIREVRYMQELDHPNILRLLSCFWYHNKNRNYLVLVTEYCSKDLMKEIKHRQAAAYYWQEEELWQHIYALISVFAYMESLHIAHRDIKPNNIFLLQNTIKVGDLGSSMMQEENQFFFTMAGTLSFLSPALLAAYWKSESQVKHDIFKSDVWSLGLTFLTMANLEFPRACNTLANLGETIETAVQGVTYSEYFKGMVRSMLQIEETNRPSFIDLYTALNPIPQTVEVVQQISQSEQNQVSPEQIQVSEDLQEPKIEYQGWDVLPENETALSQVESARVGSSQNGDKEGENQLVAEDHLCEKVKTGTAVTEPKKKQGVHRSRSESLKEKFDFNQQKSCCELM